MTVDELRNDKVTLEKTTEIIVLNLLHKENVVVPWVEYEPPLSFYLRRNRSESILKFSAPQLLKSSNAQSMEDADYFVDVDDIMNQLKKDLGGEPLDLIVSEIKKRSDIEIVTRKMK